MNYEIPYTIIVNKTHQLFQYIQKTQRNKYLTISLLGLRAMGEISIFKQAVPILKKK